jgi:hypothetical protein
LPGIGISIVGQDPFPPFAPVLKNKLQFRGLDLLPKLHDRLDKLVNIIEYTTCKKCLDTTAKSEAGWSQPMTVWRMWNSNERIFIKIVLTHWKNDLNNCPGGHSVKVSGLSFPSERPSPAKDL